MQKLSVQAHRFLKWLERFTKTDMVYLATGSFWLTIGQVISTLASFLLSLALANMLAKEAYGTYRLALSIAGLFSIFSMSGLYDSVSRAVARGYDGTLVPATKARIKGGAIGALIGLACAGYYFFNGNVTLTLTYLIIAAFLPFFDTFSTFGAYLAGKKDFRKNTLYGIAIHVISIAVLIGTLFLTTNILIILLAYFGSFTLLRLLSYLHNVKKIPAGSPVDGNAIRYGGHLSAIGVLGTVASQIDKVILFHLLGPIEVAIYSIAVSASDQVKQVLTMMDKLLFPRFSGHTEEAIRANMKRKMLLYLLASAVGVGAYILIAPWFFRIFYPQYMSAVFLSQIFSLSMLNSVFGPVVVYLESHGRVKEQYWANIISSTLQIALMAVLTYLYGLIGIIAARIATRFASGFVNLYFYYRPFKSGSIPASEKVSS